MLKVVIGILLLALIVSLFSGLVFFVKDRGETRRTVHSLGWRLVFAVLLIAAVMYGLYTGELGSQAPWDQKMRASPVQEKSR